MKIKNIKVGDIINLKSNQKMKENSFGDFQDEQWKVIKIYDHIVLTHSVKIPEIRRCFSFGDLVTLGLGMQYISKQESDHFENKYQNKSGRGLICSFKFNLVIPAGVEPAIFWMRTRRPRPLDDGTVSLS